MFPIRRAPHPRQHGFTLIELMIVTAILGLLAAIAIPQYRGYLVRSANGACLSEAASVARLIAAERGDGAASTAPAISWRACQDKPSPALPALVNGEGVKAFTIPASRPGTGTIRCHLDSAVCTLE